MRRSKRRNKKDFENNYFKWSSSSDESETNSDLDPEFIPKIDFKTEEDGENKKVKNQKSTKTNLEKESYSNLAINKEENICVASSQLAKTSHSIERMGLSNETNNEACKLPGVVRVSLGRRRKKCL